MNPIKQFEDLLSSNDFVFLVCESFAAEPKTLPFRDIFISQGYQLTPFRL